MRTAQQTTNVTHCHVKFLCCDNDMLLSGLRSQRLLHALRENDFQDGLSVMLTMMLAA